MESAAIQEVGPRTYTIPYVARTHFRPLHASKKRWTFVVAHRRAGKTVALCNKIIRKALENKRVFPPPRYGYIGPSFAQAKDLVWGYCKYYTGVLPNIKVIEGDLQIVLPNGALINLYGGAAAYERMRGLYFDGIVADEYPLLNPSMLGSVVRPCLADYQGWAVISGTSNGDDHFNELKKRAEKDPDAWDIFSIPVNETDALDPDEVSEMRKDMTADEYAREMMCSFDAPVEGSYYGEVINEISLLNQVTGVPYDPAAPVMTWWDLGIDALLGIGSTRPPGGAMASWLQQMDAALAPVLAIDLPSGLNADTGVIAREGRWQGGPGARYCLSLLTLKPGLFTAQGRDAAGEVWFDNLGCDSSAESREGTRDVRGRCGPHSVRFAGNES